MTSPVVTARTWVDINPVISATPAYTAGDVLFDTTLIPGCGWFDGQAIKLQSLMVVDVDDQTAFDFDLYFFRASTSIGTANAAFNVTTDSIMLNCVGILSVEAGDFHDYGGGKIANLNNLEMVMQTVAVSGSGSSLYVAAVNRSSTADFTAATDLHLRFGFE